MNRKKEVSQSYPALRDEVIKAKKGRSFSIAVEKDALLKNYDYEIPRELIAQKPAKKRDDSRLFVIYRDCGKFCHRKFSDIDKYFSEGDCLVINDTKVVPSRLFGKKISGGKVELLFLDPFQTEGDYRVLMKPSVDVGKKIYFEDGYECEIKSKTLSGEVIVSFNKSGITPMLEKYGIMPLPPYINRKNGLAQELADFDKLHYQTVYAQNDGAIAAPTAGLHFTPEVFKALKNKGANIAKLTLHVGWGTFKPILSDKLSQHKMMSEKFFIDAQNARIINNALLQNKKVVAVGTTSARALESAAIFSRREKDGKVLLKQYCGSADIFIYPGYEFKIVKSLITNLHLPKSTPLMMASAFSARELMLKAYKEAVREKYRFFSYGDSMLIL